MPGTNAVTLVVKGKIEEFSWDFKGEQRCRVHEVFRERESLEETFTLMERALVLSADTTEEHILLRETLMQNAALVVACFLAVTSQNSAKLPALMRHALSLLQTKFTHD